MIYFKSDVSLDDTRLNRLTQSTWSACACVGLVDTMCVFSHLLHDPPSNHVTHACYEYKSRHIAQTYRMADLLVEDTRCVAPCVIKLCSHLSVWIKEKVSCVKVLKEEHPINVE